MIIQALLMDSRDDVVTCVKMVRAGETVSYRIGNSIQHLEAKEDIPFCHKVALHDILEGDVVRKYGEIIGCAAEPITQGHLVSDKNIFSVPRDYEQEMIKGENV